MTEDKIKIAKPPRQATQPRFENILPGLEPVRMFGLVLQKPMALHVVLHGIATIRLLW